MDIKQYHKDTEGTEWGERTMFTSGDGLSRFALYTYDDDPDTLYLSNLHVDDSMRGRGIADGILDWVFGYASGNSYSAVILNVEKGSWMESWYGRRGFRYMEDCQDGYEGNVWMIKDINKTNESNMAVKNDRAVLESLIRKYGKDDVLKFVDRINEGKLSSNSRIWGKHFGPDMGYTGDAKTDENGVPVMDGLVNDVAVYYSNKYASIEDTLNRILGRVGGLEGLLNTVPDGAALPSDGEGDYLFSAREGDMIYTMTEEEGEAGRQKAYDTIMKFRRHMSRRVKKYLSDMIDAADRKFERDLDRY